MGPPSTRRRLKAPRPLDITTLATPPGTWRFIRRSFGRWAGVDPTTQQHRLGDRRPVDEVAHLAILVVQHKRKPSEEALVPVMVRDASITGACLVLPFDAAEPPVGQTLTLVIDGERGSVRVRWSRRVEDPALGQTATCGVEFVDPHPTFLPSIYVWLDRQKALGGAQMRE